MAIAALVTRGVGPGSSIPFLLLDGLGNSSTTSLSASPGNLTPGSTGNVVTLTGVGTSWTPGTPGSPTFTLSSTGTGASITAQVVASATSATITVTAGTVGLITITDPSTGDIAHISVSVPGAGAKPTFYGITLDTMRSPSGNPRKFNIGL